MKQMKKGICLLLGLIMGISCMACAAKQEESPTKDTDSIQNDAVSVSSQSTVGDHDQDIVVALQYDMGTFDTNARWANEDFPIYFLIYDRLYEYDEDTAPVPHLAKEEIIISDHEIQYQIQQGAKFSDGTEIKAVDVAASIMYAVESGIGGEQYEPIETVDIIDDYTISVKTKSFFPQLKIALSDPLCSILPASFLEEAKSDASRWSDPVCSGRYVVKDRVVGSSIELIPNPYFWDDATAPKNDSITFKIVPEASTRTIMVQTGEADLCDNFSAADVETAKSDSNVAIHSIASSRYFYIFMNCQSDVFSNKEVRRAMNYAIDREAILQVQEEGYGQIVECYVAPSSMGWMDNPAGYSYDPAKAKELLAAGGYPDGFTFELTCDSSFSSAAALIQSELAEIGVTVKIVNVEQMSDIIPLVDQDRCDAAIVAWSGPPEDILNVNPTLGANAIGANNFARYINPELEEMWADAYVADENERIAVYQQWQQILCEDCPWIPLYVNEQRALANADLKGVEMSCIMPINLYNLTYK